MYRYKYELLLVYLLVGTSLIAVVLPINWQQQATVIRNWVMVVWVLNLINLGCLGGALNRLICIRPRQLFGLTGIGLSILIHSDADHLISNTLPFIMLGWLVMLRGIPEFYAISLIILLVNGVGVWLLGRPARHLGASGLNFGYLGYLITQDNLGLSFLAIGFAFIITLLEGVYFWIALPGFGISQISWEGHSFGFLGGVITGTYPALWWTLADWYF